MTKIELYDASTDGITDFLGFCGCGDPESALEYIFEVLSGIRRLDNLKNHPRSEEFDKELKKELRIRDEFFKSEGAKYFFFYWLAKEGFLEHGSSVTAGWLTDRGKLLWTILALWKKNQDAEKEK